VPNLLFIFSDQHAQRIAGCYGDPHGATPNLDRLAAGGVVFDNAYCNSPICLPSRMSLLTGKHPVRHGCWNNDDALPSDELTYAHALGAAGCHAELIGRMHIIGPDQLHGFARREVGDHNSNWLGVTGVGHGPLAGTAGPAGVSLTRSGPGRGAYEMKDEDVAAATVARLDEIGASRKQGDDAPFAITVGLMLPHPPYVVNKDDFDFFPESVEDADIAPPEGGPHPWLAEWRDITGIDETGPADWKRSRRAYYGLVRKMDRLIGDILAALERNGLADDTLVVYASDHGDHIGDRGLFWKHTFYDESLKIPMILSWPGRLPAGERRGEIVSLIDLTATMIEALGAEALPGMDGISFLSVAERAGSPWIDEMLSEYCVDTGHNFSGGHMVRQRAIRAGRYKYVHYEGYPPQLFDLADDPGETVDLAALPAWRAVADRLRARVFSGWDPTDIERRMRERQTRKEVWARWGANIKPADTFRWRMPSHEEVRLDAGAK